MSVLEIELALRQMPPHERWEVARWLLEHLQESTAQPGAVNDSAKPSAPIPSLPDYSARRHRILGNKVLPNLVLDARASDSW